MGKKEGKHQPFIVTFYLIIYNLLSCCGWFYVLYIGFRNLSTGSLNNLWADVEIPLKIVQTAAVLEILHSAVGFVKSPWFTTTMQVFSRVWTLWAVMDIAPNVQSSVFLALASISWGLVEVPRYLFYAINLITEVPYPLFWLRYSLFAILYPTGITGELGCMYLAYQYLYDKDLYIFTPLENFPELKLSLIMLLVFVALTYIPGSPTMYMHMVKTRSKQFKLLKQSAKQS